MKRYSLLFFLILNFISSFSQQANFRKDSLAICSMKPICVSQLEIPQCDCKSCIIYHTGYALIYNEKHEQASWVAYQLTKQKTISKTSRSNTFLIDPLVTTGTANDNDYKGSNYDRGHLAPAADMGWSVLSMKESFYYSNMSPQVPAFNRGIWKKLEELVRKWAVENEQIYIVTGPILTADLPTIGTNKVSVPLAYYKVILDYSLPQIKAIGFIIPNKKSTQALTDYIVSVDEVEKITGIDFFSQLPDNQEAIIERTVCKSLWTWH